jgi:uncharacterized protein YbbC (DUF1343 family)
MLRAVDNDALLEKYLKGKRLALMVSSASLTSSLETTKRKLKRNYSVSMLLAPEHGINGAKGAGEEFGDETDDETGLPVVSLYGGDSSSLKEKMKDVDAVVYDVQDVGIRCYTYISSLYQLMELCEETETELIVLDRPDPLSRRIEGVVMEDRYRSFVGCYSLPMRYGLTCGEVIEMIKAEEKRKVSLTVVPLTDYDPSLFYDDCSPLWISPSPALSSFQSTVLYSGFALLEATNLSEGRGTSAPFSFMGAPFIESWRLADELAELSLPGVAFAPASFVPSFSKYAGELCNGVEAIITDKKAFNGIRSALSFLLTVDSLYGDRLSFLPSSSLPGAKINSLLGTEFRSIETLRELSRNDWEILTSNEEGFRKRSMEYRRY